MYFLDSIQLAQLRRFVPNTLPPERAYELAALLDVILNQNLPDVGATIGQQIHDSVAIAMRNYQDLLRMRSPR